MKSLVFRPLRRVGKAQKVTVAAYSQWRKVFTADYRAFQLIVNNEYAQLPAGEFVYDHAGRQLFWADFKPDEVPVFDYSVLFSLEQIRAQHQRYGIRWSPESRVSYSGCRSLDCDGVPTFSHFTAEHVAEHFFATIDDFEPLTVGVVVAWFGWFLYQLENASLQIGRGPAQAPPSTPSV